MALFTTPIKGKAPYVATSHLLISRTAACSSDILLISHSADDFMYRRRKEVVISIN